MCTAQSLNLARFSGLTRRPNCRSFRWDESLAHPISFVPMPVVPHVVERVLVARIVPPAAGQCPARRCEIGKLALVELLENAGLGSGVREIGRRPTTRSRICRRAAWFSVSLESRCRYCTLIPVCL